MSGKAYPNDYYKTPKVLVVELEKLNLIIHNLHKIGKIDVTLYGEI
jgi:hypothetical protein